MYKQALEAYKIELLESQLQEIVPMLTATGVIK